MRGTIALLLLAAGFTAGVLYLFGLEFAAGDVYPEYSSLRSDPMGAKLLFESLGQLPGITAGRSYVPLDSVQENDVTVLVLALDPEKFTADPQAIEGLESFARRGNRVVAALASKPDSDERWGGELERAWHVRLAVDDERKHVHKLYFAQARDWHALDQVGRKMLAIERDFGRGSIALFAESEAFANESTVVGDRLELVCAALGAHSRILFDEQHLGIVETGSIVGLARRFRLTGLGMGLALCATLFVWRNASAFPPPAARGGAARLAGRTSHAGLLTLLRRHIAPEELLAACWQEWLAVNRRSVPAERIERAAAMVKPGERPVEAAREIQAVLGGSGRQS